MARFIALFAQDSKTGRLLRAGGPGAKRQPTAGAVGIWRAMKSSAGGAALDSLACAYAANYPKTYFGS